MKFIDRYDDFIKICRGLKNPPHRLRMPEIQIDGLEKTPNINQTIIPTPRDWFINSFDWYVGLKLIRGGIYGPFYRIDGNFFWPQIGNYYDVYSEKQCFFGLEAPKDKKDAVRLYNILPTTDTKYVYEIWIEMPKWPVIDDAYIFLGSVKNGAGFQINPNGRVVELLREKIIKQEIKRYSQSPKGKYNYKKSEVYIININQVL